MAADKGKENVVGIINELTDKKNDLVEELKGIENSEYSLGTVRELRKAQEKFSDLTNKARSQGEKTKPLLNELVKEVAPLITKLNEKFRIDKQLERMLDQTASLPKINSKGQVAPPLPPKPVPGR